VPPASTRPRRSADWSGGSTSRVKPQPASSTSQRSCRVRPSTYTTSIRRRRPRDNAPPGNTGKCLWTREDVGVTCRGP
jgi:hypothetical protein